MANRSTRTFLLFVLLWEIAVGLIYGFFIRYNTDSFAAMAASSPDNIYKLSLTPSSNINIALNSTQYPFPQMVVVIAIVLLIVGRFGLI